MTSSPPLKPLVVDLLVGRGRGAFGRVRKTLGVHTERSGARRQRGFIHLAKSVILFPGGQTHVLCLPLLQFVQFQRRHYLQGVVALFVLCSEGGGEGSHVYFVDPSLPPWRFGRGRRPSGRARGLGRRTGNDVRSLCLLHQRVNEGFGEILRRTEEGKLP